jgi:hypothetical protein
VEYERAQQFRAAAEVERRAVAAAAEEFRCSWEATDCKDREMWRMAMILSFEPSIEELGWRPLHVYDCEWENAVQSARCEQNRSQHV